MTEHDDYDVLIIGGGMVGASLACALGGQSLKIGIIEAIPFRSGKQPSFDDRSIALAYGSRRIFEGMGLWPQLEPGVTPIHSIQISDRGHFGKTRLHYHDSGCEALGYVVDNRTLGAALTEKLAQFDNISLLCPARLTGLTLTADKATAVIERNDQSQTLSARLVIGADGGHSAVRQLADIQARQWDYGQSAIITNVSTGTAHHNMAYERFTASGPLALLPLSRQRYSLVWTVPATDSDKVMAYDDEQFLTRLQQHVGHHVGRFIRTGTRHCYPLTLIRAHAHQQPRLALIGNAAHTLHPIAGQGFNLGLRDVAALAQTICDALQKQRDIGSARMLRQYEQWRQRDQRHVTALTDSLVRVFSNSVPPLVVARNIGLLAVDCLPPLKKALMRQTMGLAGHLPRLARGLPL